MNRVKDILLEKKGEVWSISPEKSVLEALQIMADKDIGALMVIDSEGKLHGIITERDYARKVVLKGRSSQETKVSEIMTPVERLYTVRPETSLEDCMVLITAKHIRHLPVFENDRFVGLISIGDIVKAVISEKDKLIAQLSDYIAGKYV